MKVSAKKPTATPKRKPKAKNSLIVRANPIASTIQTIHGYPDRLKIYQIPASKYWWVRATFGERRIKRSTKETEKTKAVKFAKQFYEDLLKNSLSVPIKSSRSFIRVAEELKEEHRQKAGTGERNKRFADDLRKQLDHRIIPFFKQYTLKDINYSTISKFVAEMRKNGCSPSTINRHLVSVRQILKHAIKLELLGALPIFPTVTAKDNPRPWFDEAEYKLLKSKAEEAIEKGHTWKGVRMTEEMRDFILFMVNTFLRPSDWYGLKRKHIQIQKQNGDESILIISPPTSKTINTPIVSMPAAVKVYQNIIERQDAEYGKDKPNKTLGKEAYVFLPQIESRNFAQSIYRNFFDHILTYGGLKTSYSGGGRTIYSLRHTAIAFRLLKGDNVDLLFLARNCRTSVSMIDRFYCRHLNALMAPEKIIGFKKTKNKN